MAGRSGEEHQRGNTGLSRKGNDDRKYDNKFVPAWHNCNSGFSSSGHFVVSVALAAYSAICNVGFFQYAAGNLHLFFSESWFPAPATAASAAIFQPEGEKICEYS